jgi:hypothetical protein
MTGWGQKLLLPLCNGNDRFSSISGHNVGRVLAALPTGLGRYVTAICTNAGHSLLLLDV